MADVSSQLARLNGTNAPTNYIQQDAYLVDLAVLTALLPIGTHTLFKLPKGAMLTGIKLLSISAVTSGGSATLALKANVGGTAGGVGSSIAVADLAAGNVNCLSPSAIKAYSATEEIEIQVTVATAALTGGKLMVVAEYIPAASFQERG